LWAGVGGDLRALKRLQASIERQIAPLGYPAEERGFSPHLTLGRAAPGASRDEIAQIGGLTATHDPGLLAEWHISSLSLMRSQLKPDGAVYTRAYEVALASG
jgi:2'-5' RNA ligase